MANRRSVLAHHLVFTGYGHWFPNDPRGSGSESIRQDKLESLGQIHPGRKPVQPRREALRSFFAIAESLLEHPVLWFEGKQRALIGDTFARVIQTRGYTAWACAILPDHAHLCIRIHRDDYHTMWDAFSESARDALRAARPDWGSHPIWAARPNSKYCLSTQQIRAVIDYIRGNPAKHTLPNQSWEFVKEYNGWPLHKRKR